MDYSAIFGERAGSYVQACELWPEIRSEEFKAYLDKLELQRGERLLDAPCGNGMFAPFVPSFCRYEGLDPAPAFIGACRSVGIQCHASSLRSTGLPCSGFDVVGSLTGIHHEHNRLELYQEWFRLLRPGGRLIVMDVARGSRVAEFLNGFVDRWNSGGHQGDFLGEEDGHCLIGAGFREIAWSDTSYNWSAQNEEDMYAFMIKLFGLDKEPKIAEMQEAWRRLGWHPGSGRCLVPWELRVLSAVKPKESGNA